MVHYYLDIETYGKGKPDPSKDEIITVMFCAIDSATGKKVQEPILMKAWESSEEDIVKKLKSRILGKRVFDFVPVGFGILFDLWFLKEKFKKYCGIDLGDRFYLERPYIDLKHVSVLSNRGVFKGAGIGAEGNPIRDWYEYKDYKSIERHAMEKMEKFLEKYSDWSRKLTSVK